MPNITSIFGRTVYNSRGSKTIEVDVTVQGGYVGRVCAPSGASVGKYEAMEFPKGGPEKCVQLLMENISKFSNTDASNAESVYMALRSIDSSHDYSKLGGATAFAISIAAAKAAAKERKVPLFAFLSDSDDLRFPYPLGNILGGGAHAGPGTPDIQEILVCAIGAKTVREAIDTNFAVHKELGNLLKSSDADFTNGRGDEGGWAPKMNNQTALEISAKACENLGYTLGKEVSLGVDFASSTQWNGEKYAYKRAGFENDSGQQIDFVSDIIEKFKLVYAEDAVHEEAFSDMAEITAKFPRVMITGDDLIVTNKEILDKAISINACNAAILKVNQAGSLYDALEFATLARTSNTSIITSHRSGESSDSHISHIGVATGSKMLKIGIIGGERVAKLNELVRMAEHDLIHGMAEL
ncbi:MAG: phosphopyruvate hydratase [Cenarchaeum symbiont of Oopsacas minuta]|nr:phosphopyruvate hydratase [Cenarchaeum symbiont of Oopsacas minuta]